MDLGSKNLSQQSNYPTSFRKIYRYDKINEQSFEKNHRYNKINGRNFEKCNVTIKSTGFILKNVTLRYN
jgi:stress response protein YsnF